MRRLLALPIMMYAGLACAQIVQQIVPGPAPSGGGGGGGGGPDGFVSGGGAQSANGNNVTVSGLNMTSPANANRIEVVVSSTGAGGTVTDSSGNTYTAGATFGANPQLARFCVAAPAVTSSMSFTYTCTSSGCFPAIGVGGFSGTNGNCTVDQSNTSTASGPVTVSATPSVSGEAWVSAVGQCASGTAATLSFGTSIIPLGCVPGSAYGFSMAYGLQGSPALVTEVWSGPGVSQNATMITFK